MFSPQPYIATDNKKRRTPKWLTSVFPTAQKVLTQQWLIVVISFGGNRLFDLVVQVLGINNIPQHLQTNSPQHKLYQQNIYVQLQFICETTSHNFLINRSPNDLYF